MDEFLRKECKYLKCFQKVSYKDIAQHLEIKTNSFYSWLNGAYNLGADKQKKLFDIIGTLKEV